MPEPNILIHSLDQFNKGQDKILKVIKGFIKA